MIQICYHKTMNDALQVNNLSFDYTNCPLLKGINITLPSGHLLHVKGENGSGKTTFLKLLAGLFVPTEGSIRFRNLSLKDNKSLYQRNVCYVGHKLGIHAALSIGENRFFDLHYGRNELDWLSIMDALSLSGLERLPCHYLSAGQKRRVALLRLFMSNAVIWLLDEPFVTLDTKAQGFLMQKIIEHLNKGGCVVLTSHQSLPLSCEHYLEYQL